ncbi:ATP-binding protein [Accumulibacter sp.]|uniref:ATP-binding protein n=1 Tax=Accumulibacter sp. TaxID=2053492 RepID=UPI0025EBCF5E|nr:ATP-binding protein [Accumulibacter sp.]MCM8594101.1 HAMP domain-containing protein [Accumulibacter sp.]MCM8624510.1 HAMP domain-containing protein [Accumulibacter sp.]MDS4048244.1 HAMP domain-containing protein [Accumulibacter sp.]
MIRLTIQRKVFIAIFALATALVLLLALAMRWNLGQGFERYTTAAEFARLDWLIANVEGEYAANGSWDFLRADPERTWRRLSRPNPPGGSNAEPSGRPPGFAQERGEPPPRPAGDDHPPPPTWNDTPPRPGPEAAPPPGRPDPQSDRPPPPHDTLRIGPRLALLDADGKRLAGNPHGERVGAERPILHQGKLVGRLTLEASPTSVQELDKAFLASQNRNLMLAGFAALGLSLLAAWLLARHLLAPIRDVTDGARRIAEGWLDARIPVRRDDELGELAGSFNTMAERLAKVEESRRAWISDASHELRTPLAVLRAEIEALQDGVRIADAATLTRLHKQVQQLSALVDDLRLTVDQAPGAGAMEHRPFSPLAVLDEAIESFRERFAAANIAMEVSGMLDTQGQVRGDAGRLAQVFANLLENTLRYTDAGGRLRITVGINAERLALQFDDSAPAPPRSALPHLFERFYRTEPSRSRALGGSGLGLAICKALVEAHGGCVSASLSELGGLAIRIELPLENA